MPIPRPSTWCLLVALGQVLAAQSPARWLEDLGDPAKGEAAERELLGLGKLAIEPLQKLFDDWSDATGRDRERLRAALRVVDLLGPTAAPLAPCLAAAANADRKDLAIALVDARASLTPWANEQPWHEQFHRLAHGGRDEDKADRMRAFFRYAVRSGVAANLLDWNGATVLLEDDDVFAREVAAEVMGNAGNPEAIELLSQRLLARRPPKGHDGLRRNGFVVPVEDRFLLRASDALIRLAPDDPRSAIGYACRAVVHPHRAARLQALRDLSRFGPDARVAAPELMVVAQRADDEMSIEALKVLGMIGRDAGPFLPAIESLAGRGGTVARLAGNLVKGLRAMAAAPAAGSAPVDAAVLATIDAAVTALADRDDPAVTAAAATLLANAELAWPRLLERFRRDYGGTPECLLRLLGQLAPARPPADRDTLRFAIASLGTDNWHAPMMASYTGGRALRPLHAALYGEIVVGDAAALPDLVAWLSHKNTGVRLAAARALARRHADVAAPAREGKREAMDALLAAAEATVPARCNFEIAPGDDHELECDVGTALQAAAAVALASCDLPPATRASLFAKAIAHDDEALVAHVVAAWAEQATLEDLERAARDARPTVATAARVALAARAGK